MVVSNDTRTEIRMSKELKDAALRCAAARNISLSALVKALLTDLVKADEEEYKRMDAEQI